MPIYQYLDVSTGNITEHDAELLINAHIAREYASGPPMRVIDHDYGWWVNVQHETAPADTVARLQALLDHGYSEAFIALYELAHRKGCNWINLDRDAELEKGLAVFEW